MVSPSALEVSLDATLCQSRKPSTLCKLNFDGLAGSFEQRSAAAHCSQAALICSPGASYARRCHGGFARLLFHSLELRLARAANRKLLAMQIGRLARRGGLTRPILWIAIPTAADMIGQFDEQLGDLSGVGQV